MKKQVKLAIAFGAGLLAGSGLTYIFTKRHYELEIEDLENFYTEELDLEDDDFEEPEEDRASIEAITAEISKRAQSKPSIAEYARQNSLAVDKQQKMATDYSAAFKTEEFPNKHTDIITKDEYESNTKFGKETLEWYNGDKILVTSADEELNAIDTLGADFDAHFGDEEEDMLFVRNYRLGTDFEVVFLSGKYYFDIPTSNPADGVREWDQEDE